MRHRLGLPAAIAGLGLILAAGLAACGGENAVDDSKLVIYSGRQEDLVGPLIERFEESTGIETSVRYGNTAQLAAQILEEGDRTPADVYFSQDGGALGALAKGERLARLSQGVLDRIPERYRSADGTWIGTSGRARVIVYDPDQLSPDEIPDSVMELTDPRWTGKIGISPSNASFEAFVTAMRVMEGEDVTREWLEGIKANDVQTFDNNILVLNAAEDGLIALGLINHYYWYEQVAEEGLEAVPARLKFLDNEDPGALVNVAGAGVLRGADHAGEARKFVDFLVSPQAQRYFATETKEYPLIEGVPAVEDLPPLDSLNSPDIDLSDLDTLEHTLRMIEDAGLT
ncbi:iron ABC transporter substrate-binding protein [Actinopolymorpha sp. B11F2]|uniref:iron ABC transporter substrate-binding protein n=1 Tax=Actinopolymorpha sp. B11F2 TaxID=3160862 RepID=UPI0032E52772